MQSMSKIVSAEVFPVMVPFVRPYRWAFGELNGACALIVRLEDEGGIVGWGEVPTPYHPGISGAAVAIFAQTLLDKMVVGSAPSPRSFVASAFAHGGWHFFPQMGGAVVGGLETALWDMVGRQKNMRVVDMLGGPVRSKMECMCFIFDDDLPKMVDVAVKAAAEGFRVFYLKWADDARAGLEKLHAISDAVGDNCVLRIDPNESWTSASAPRYCRMLEDLPIEFIEQPLPYFDLDGLRDLRQRTPLAIASDQATRTPQDAFRGLAMGAMDLLSVCPSDAGGILRSLDITAAARSRGVPVFMHSNVELGLGQAASLAVSCLSENATYAAQTEYNRFAWDITSGLEFDGASIVLPEGPGLGLEIDEDNLAKARQNFENGMGNTWTLDTTVPKRFFPAY